MRENDLLRLSASSCGLAYERSSKAALLRRVEQFFRGWEVEGKRVLLVVDEVQSLPRESLEELRIQPRPMFPSYPLPTGEVR